MRVKYRRRFNEGLCVVCGGKTDHDHPEDDFDRVAETANIAREHVNLRAGYRFGQMPAEMGGLDLTGVYE